jgi:Sulfotransferase family
MSTMSPEDVRRLGAGMQAIAPKAERVVDKLPLNFLRAGLIHLALPNARIACTCRDPVEICGRIIAHCGLDVEDAGLGFHQTRRPVQIASATRVRQPISCDSLRRWLPYRDLLQPLLQGT